VIFKTQSHPIIKGCVLFTLNQVVNKKDYCNGLKKSPFGAVSTQTVLKGQTKYETVSYQHSKTKKNCNICHKNKCKNNFNIFGKCPTINTTKLLNPAW
jgi:hypothetical protein